MRTPGKGGSWSLRRGLRLMMLCAVTVPTFQLPDNSFADACQIWPPVLRDITHLNTADLLPTIRKLHDTQLRVLRQSSTAQQAYRLRGSGVCLRACVCCVLWDFCPT